MSFSTKVVTTYAKSLFQNLENFKGNKQTESFKIATITSADQNNFIPDIFVLGEELILVSSIIVSSKTLKDFFTNPITRDYQKLDVILNIFPGLTLTMKSFLKILTERNHLSLIPFISEQYNTFLTKVKNSTKVKVILSSSLTDTFGDSFLTTLKKLTGSNEVILYVAYNPKLLGGIIFEYNSVAIDASILKEFSLFFTEI